MERPPVVSLPYFVVFFLFCPSLSIFCFSIGRQFPVVRYCPAIVSVTLSSTSNGSFSVTTGFELTMRLFHSKVIDPARLSEALPASMRPSMNGPTSPGAVGGDGKVRTPQSPGLDPNKPLQLPTLIAPRFIPQLQEMAQRMIGAGHHQQCLKVYR